MTSLIINNLQTKQYGRFDSYQVDPVTLAKRLLGQRLVRIIQGKKLSGIIVEVEAYLGASDKATHTYNGRRTPRNEAMYLDAGHSYVYFTYGMHHCVNVVAGAKEEGVAVLIRALEPVEGIEQMYSNRATAKCVTDLCSGPAKLCQALKINRELNKEDLRISNRLFIEQIRKRAVPSTKIFKGPRIGVEYAQEWSNKPLRFYFHENQHISASSRR